MQQITHIVKTGTTEAAVEAIYGYIEDNAFDVDTVPHLWVECLNQYIIDKYDDGIFWQIVSKREDYMTLINKRRFFPKCDDEIWNQITKDKIKEDYPDYENKTQKHNNFENIDNAKLHSNYGSIPYVDVKTLKAEMKSVYRDIANITRLENKTTQLLLWTSIATNHEYCHTVLKENVEFTFDMYEYDNVRVRTTLYWTMFVLSHEENTNVDYDVKNRSVFTLTEVCALDFLNGLPVDHSPWIINYRYGQIANVAPFYLTGPRSVCNYVEFVDRVHMLTAGCLANFDIYDNAALVGSIIPECLGNNALSTEYGFAQRSELYYKNGSDIDIAIRSASGKKFVETATKMIEHMNRNLHSQCTVKLDYTTSGIRYHISHPKIPRTIEIFRVNMDFAKLVSGFHVSAVRAYWDFSNVYILRSCAAALYTGVNENFKWFSTAKVPADVILKYAQRGYATILNTKERDTVSDYMQKSPKWDYNLKEITGTFDISSTFFNVTQIPLGVRYDQPAIKNTNVIQTKRLKITHIISKNPLYNDPDFVYIACPHGGQS